MIISVSKVGSVLFVGSDIYAAYVVGKTSFVWGYLIMLMVPNVMPNGGVAQLVEQRTSNPQIRCSSPGLLAALSRGLSRKRLQVSALPRQWIRLFNGLTV